MAKVCTHNPTCSFNPNERDCEFAKCGYWREAEPYKPVKCARKGFCHTAEIADHTTCIGCLDNVTDKPVLRSFAKSPSMPQGCGECVECDIGHPERCTRRE